MATQNVTLGLRGCISVGDFKFIIDADRATLRDVLVDGAAANVTLSGVYAIYKYVKLREQEFKTAVNEALGGNTADQQISDIKQGSLHVSLHCFKNQRFLEVLKEYKAGKIKTRLKKKLSDIGIRTEGLVVCIKNIEEVEEKAAAMR